MSAILPHIVWP